MSLRASAGLVRALWGDAREGPSRMTAILTERCHLRCQFCRLWESPDDGASAEEWVEVFRCNPQLRWLNLSGGEIFAKDGLDQVLSGALEHLPRLALLDFPTAGQRTDRCVETVEFLRANSRVRLVVSVSVDGGRELHDSLRGVEGAFDRALETYRRLRERQDDRFQVRLGCTLTERAREQRTTLERDVQEAIQSFRAEREVHYNLAHHSSHYYRNEEFQELPLEDATEILAERRFSPGPIGWAEWVYGRLASRALKDRHPPTGCVAVRHTVFVSPDLTVRPCSIWDRPLGALRDHGYSLARVLALATAKEAREEIEARRCPGCFTPCEALPAMVARPFRATTRALWATNR